MIACHLAGPLRFSAFACWKPCQLSGMSSRSHIADAIHQGLITTPGTYALGVGAEVALVEVEEIAAKPILRVVT